MIGGDSSSACDASCSWLEDGLFNADLAVVLGHSGLGPAPLSPSTAGGKANVGGPLPYGDVEGQRETVFEGQNGI